MFDNQEKIEHLREAAPSPVIEPVEMGKAGVRLIVGKDMAGGDSRTTQNTKQSYNFKKNLNRSIYTVKKIFLFL
ncbi:MAG: hypothetical protein H7A25_11930 [Leptospiraceae bacterium]|nr:hypothetical protein [Leptospiraceae bacterium]